MKSLMRAIDKFCLSHRRFGLPRLMLYVIFGYGLAYLISILDPSGAFLRAIVFNPDLILRGQVWRLFTWVFYPSTGGMLPMTVLFTALMLYFYYFIGTTLEREWGTPKFTIYYLSGILLNVLFAFAVRYIAGVTLYLHSSFLNLSMFFAFAVLYPEQRVLLFFFIPVKIKWLALVSGAYFLLIVIRLLIGGFFWNALLPVVAVLNFFVFCFEDLVNQLRPYRARTSRQAINFRQAARKQRHEEAARPYRHKCAVCGKTDAEFPGLEFRYCSKCSGYHCFCIDHINSHIHFQ